jgi:hypothetical protein
MPKLTSSVGFITVPHHGVPLESFGVGGAAGRQLIHFTQPMIPPARFVAFTALSLTVPTSVVRAGFLTFEDAGANPAAIQATVDAFRAPLGPLNPNTGGSFASGRREINWDGVPDGSADPNPFPGDFFASVSLPGRARGAAFTTPGTGFLVSADSSNPTATSTLFGFPADLGTFSAERLFTPIGSTITDITFFEAGSLTPATVTGFGAIFVDVEVADSTRLEAFDLDGNTLFARSVPTAGNGGFSFLGLLADGGERIARIRLDSGDNALLGNGSLGHPSDDLVVMDDFIYAEPQAVRTGGTVVPETSTVTAVVAGLAGAIGWQLRHRRRTLR